MGLKNGMSQSLFKRKGDHTVEFDAKATEVSILNRAGQPIWTKSRGEMLTPIRWDGIAENGQTVDSGDYICKIVYPNDETTYVPFVFIAKPPTHQKAA